MKTAILNEDLVAVKQVDLVAVKQAPTAGFAVRVSSLAMIARRVVGH
ncbi:MAG: hypothetical protein ABSB82_01265 [Terriglobia bacterium]